MNDFKIDIDYSKLNVSSFNELSIMTCPIKISINGINITSNSEEKTPYVEDVPFYLILSLLNLIPDLKAGYSQKYIFFNTPICFELEPAKEIVKIKPYWTDDQEYLNSGSDIFNKEYTIDMKKYFKEILRNSDIFYEFVKKNLPQEQFELLS